MLHLLSRRNPTRLLSLNKVSYLSFRYSSVFFSTTSSSSLENHPAIPNYHESSSFSLFYHGKLDSISRSLDGAAKESHRCVTNSSLKDLLLELSDVVPNETRRFRRCPGLKPENILELLLGFDSELQRGGIGSRKVRALWEIFRWASGQYMEFKHLPQACEIMASMLIREGMVKEVELLLMEMENNGNKLENQRIFCDLIQKYVDNFDSRKAVMLFDWMRLKGLVPLTSCYLTLVDHLVRVYRTESAYRICLDWVETTDESDNLSIFRIGKLIELLCLDLRVQEARVLARKLVAMGCNLNSSIYSKITLGYNEKLDFEDLLSFIAEIKYEPDVLVGNRIVHSLCKRFGSERAYVYMEELEHLGFKPDEATFGILIGWCCHERDIKRAFLYLSVITSKGLKPTVYSYNAILSGLFRKGLWQHSRCVLDEMKENGIPLSLSTCKIMVAGYCKARQFEEAKKIVDEMFGNGLIKASKVEDPLSEAFNLVGFDPLAVRLKRDNGSGVSKAEFFDDLGNGLYLDTDLDAYEQRLNMVLDRSVLPEFNLLIVRACKDGDLQTALGLLDEMVRWGQKLSRQSFAVLMKSLCASRSHVRVSVSLFGKWPKLANQLDAETLNFLVQEYCKNRLSRQSKLIFHRMVHMQHPIDNTTYTSLISCFSKKETLSDLLNVWEAAQNVNWLPDLHSCGALWECLVKKGLVEEAVKLSERILVSYPLSQSEACKIFVKKLTVLGFSDIAHSVAKRLEGEGYIVEQEVYNHLIKGLCKDKNESGAFAILEEMLEKKHIPSLGSCLALIPWLCGANKTERAFTLAEQSDSSSVYCALIRGLCLAGMISDAENQLRIMLGNRLLPDNDTYNLILQGYCKGNNTKKAEEVLGILVRRNVICSVASYREYVRKMCLGNRFLSAISLKEILLLGESNHDGVIIYNLLIFYLFRAKNRLEVSKTLLGMQARGLLPDETTLNFLVHGYSLSGDDSSSLRYLSVMISEGMKPNNRSLRVVINSLCGNGDVKKALDLWQVMKSKGWILDSSVVQTKIVESLISKGEILNAEDFLTRVTRYGTYDHLITKFADRGNLDIAVHLLNTMLKNQKIPDSSSYDSVINGFLRWNNQLDVAMDFHTEMMELGLSPSLSTWSGLVHKHCEASQATEAERLIKSMIGLGETPSQEMFKTVIDRFRVENNTVKASEMMEMMQKCGFEIDFETHWSLISNMSSCKEKKTNGQGFLSRLLSGNGFAWKR